MTMPIYAYRCEACGTQHDALQKLSDAPLVDCPKCGKPSLSKMLTAAGFQLKGSGWYATDFKGGSKSASDSSSGGKDESKASSDAAAATCGAGACAACS